MKKKAKKGDEQMRNIIWKQGDMCFFEYELSEIMKVENGNIVEISTGIIRTCASSFNDRCVPVTLKNKLISRQYEKKDNELQDSKFHQLNYPDIADWMAAHWMGTCSCPNERIEERYKELDIFVEEILNKIKELKSYRLESGIHFLREV